MIIPSFPTKYQEVFIRVYQLLFSLQAPASMCDPPTYNILQPAEQLAIKCLFWDGNDLAVNCGDMVWERGKEHIQKEKTMFRSASWSIVICISIGEGEHKSSVISFISLLFSL